ncbi:MAG: cadherin-like domain-containing protein, partial [Nitrospira sp.]
GELTVTDVDHAAAQLTYSIGTGPAYGRLELSTAPGISTSSFTQADIIANRLVYVHDGSEATSDSFTFTVSDGAGGTLGTTTMTLTITPVNDTPTITSDGGVSTAAITVAENVSAVTIVTGADVDLPAQAFTYNISGGVDQARFTINATTGALNFIAPPNFEVATDANGDNVYVVQVRVVDSQGASTTQTIQVTVRDVAEGIPPSPTTPLIPPVLLPTTPPSQTDPGLVPSSPASLAASPTDALPPSPVVSGPRATPVELHPTTAVQFPFDSRTEQADSRLPDDLRKPMDLAKDQPPFTVLAVEPAPVLVPEPPEGQPSVSEHLPAKLDEMAASLEYTVGVSEERHALITRIVALTGTTLSVGFIAWAIRSGALLAGFKGTLSTGGTLARSRSVPTAAVSVNAGVKSASGGVK